MNLPNSATELANSSSTVSSPSETGDEKQQDSAVDTSDDEKVKDSIDGDDATDDKVDADVDSMASDGTVDADDTMDPPALDELDQKLFRAIRLDRSQARLRLPTPMVAEALRIANNLTFPHMDITKIDDLDKNTVELLQDHAILLDGAFDPIVNDLLTVINQASLMITIDLHFASDSSHRTIWATPREGVVSNDVEPNLIEFQPADVNHLPLILHQMILARSPRYVGASAIMVPVATMTAAERQRENGQLDYARQTLLEVGLSDEQASIVLSFDARRVRRWRITSAWSTATGHQSRELRGIDTGIKGTWLVAMTNSRTTGERQLMFSPQGHGDVMRSLRAVLPKTWLGIPLRPPGL